MIVENRKRLSQSTAHRGAGLHVWPHRWVFLNYCFRDDQIISRHFWKGGNTIGIKLQRSSSPPSHTALTLLQMLWTHHWGENGAVGRNHLALIQTQSERNLQAPNAYRRLSKCVATTRFFLSFFPFNWDANQVLWSSQTVALKKLNNLEQSTFYFLKCLTFLLFPPVKLIKRQEDYYVTCDVVMQNRCSA